MQILLATDGTAPSGGAVRIATSLATDPGTSIRVLHVLEPLAIQGPPSAHLLAPSDPDFADQRKAAASARVREWLADFGPTAADWPLEVWIGPVAGTIVRAAEAGGATLILLGSGRHERADRWFGTETALRVIQLSHIPVLAVPPTAGDRPKVVLGAADFSSFSGDAISKAMEVCGQEAQLHVAHVLRQRPYDLGGIDESLVQEFSERTRDRFDEWVGAREDIAAARPKLHQLQGDAAEELLRLAEEIDADLIAAGSHGAGFFGRLMLGSVSTRILRGSTCSVLVAPPRERASELDAVAPPVGFPTAL